jgi:hypothetical protein
VLVVSTCVLSVFLWMIPNSPTREERKTWPESAKDRCGLNKRVEGSLAISTGP